MFDNLEYEMKFIPYYRTALICAIFMGFSSPIFGSSKEKNIYETDERISTKNGKGYDFGPLAEIEPTYIVNLRKALKEGGEILSAACGYGRTEYRALLGEDGDLYHKPHKDFKLTLVDLSKEHLLSFWKAVKSKFGQEFYNKHIRIVRGDCLRFLHKEGEESRYDLLYAAMFIHFLSPDEVDTFLRGARKALKKDAPLYLISGTPYRTHYKLKYFTDTYTMPACASIDSLKALAPSLMIKFNKLFYEARISGKKISKPKYKQYALNFEDYEQQILYKVLNADIKKPARIKEFPGWMLPSLIGIKRNYFTSEVLSKVLEKHGFDILVVKYFPESSSTLDPDIYHIDTRETIGVISLNRHINDMSTLKTG